MKPFRLFIVLLATLAVLAGCSDQDTSVEPDADAPAAVDQTAEPEEVQAMTDAHPGVEDPAADDADMEVLDIAEHSVDGTAALAVVLSTPVAADQKLADYLSVEIQQGSEFAGVESAWQISENQRILYYSGPEPASRYRVIIKPGLPAANGSLLEQRVEQEINTRQIAPGVGFSGSGTILPTELSEGLQISTFNIDAVDLSFYRLSAEHWGHFFSQVQHNGLRNYWQLSQLDGVLELAYTARYDMDISKNTRQEFAIPVSGIPALQQPGIYIATMRPAGSLKYDQLDATWFTVSDIGLHARFTRGTVDIYLSSIASGKVLQDADVQLLDGNGDSLALRPANLGGFARFSGLDVPPLNEARFVIATRDNQLTMMSLQEPALDLSDFNIGIRPQRRNELFLYSARDLYRPGEEITVSGLLRDHDGRIRMDLNLGAEFRRPDGTLVGKTTLKPGTAGYYQHTFKLERNAPTGTWQFEVRPPGGQIEQYAFKVEEFLPERMKLMLNGATEKLPVFEPDQEVVMDVLGEYLYGAPADGNRVEGSVDIRLFREPFEQWRNYQFGDIRETGIQRQFELDPVHLDSEGKGKLTVPNYWQQARSPVDVYIYTSLFESGGRPVSRGAHHLVWPTEYGVGIRPSFDDKSPPAYSDVGFDLIVTDQQGSAAADRKLDAVLIYEDRQYFWVYDQYRGWHYEHSESEYQVASRSITSSADGPANISFPVDYGHYRLEVTDQVSGVKSSVRFHAGRDWYYWYQRDQVNKNQAARPDSVAVSFDKESYQKGETAELTIVPPDDGEAIVVIESSTRQWDKRLRVSKQGTKVQIPVKAYGDRHNLYATVIYLRAGDRDHGVAPKRAIGIAHLKLDREDRRLPVSISAPSMVQPETSVAVEVDTGKTGEDVYVTLAAVDVGVLNITDFQTPDPHEWFFGQRRYATDSRDIYQKIMELSTDQHARQRFGGDAEIAKGGERPQTDVKIVSLFSGVVQADQQGKANIDLDLPEFEGRLRLMAVAFTDSEYGHAEEEMTVRSPLVVQLATPRFMAPMDETTLALDLHNLSGQSQELDLVLTTEGGIDISDQQRSLVLQDGEKQTLRFAASATAISGPAQIYLHIGGLEGDQSAGGELKRAWQLGVRPGWAAENRHLRTFVDPGEVFQLPDGFSDGLIPETGQARLVLSTLPELDIQQHMDRLLAYPYGCLEQTSSRLYPLIYGDPQKIRQLGLVSPVTEAERLDWINQGINRLFTMQLPSGGFGYWSTADSEQHWVTVYAADLLLNAREQGIAVDQDRLNQVLNRLRYYLNHQGNQFLNQRWSDRADFYAFATKAYAAYVLSRVKQAPLGTLRVLFDQRRDDALSPVPLVHLGLALRKMGDHRRADEAIAAALKVDVNERRNLYYGDYGSPLRDTAQTIYLLARHQSQDEQIKTMLVELVDRLRERRYLSTQERNYLFLAGLETQGLAGLDWQAEVLLGERQLSFDQTGRWQGASQSGDTAVSVENTGSSAMYVSALVNGYSRNRPEPRSSDGLSIQRSYYDISGKPVTLETVTEGDLYIAHVTVSSGRRAPDLLVVDMLPAGFELENPNLPQSYQIADIKIDSRNVTEWQRGSRILHQEYRDDRYVAAIDGGSWGPAQLFYVVRAVTPGEYVVPPPYVEDMYLPEKFAIGESAPERLKVEAGATR